MLEGNTSLIVFQFNPRVNLTERMSREDSGKSVVNSLEFRNEVLRIVPEETRLQAIYKVYTA